MLSASLNKTFTSFIKLFDHPLYIFRPPNLDLLCQKKLDEQHYEQCDTNVTIVKNVFIKSLNK